MFGDESRITYASLILPHPHLWFRPFGEPSSDGPYGGIWFVIVLSSIMPPPNSHSTDQT